jgi:pimeloyl-ACP methyl ester carboxylesterase
MADKPTNVSFFLQGGTLGSSVYFESAMHKMSDLLGPMWWIVTLDHRGVGRSSRLGCELTQGETPASPDGTSLTDDEFTACKDAIVKSLGTWSFLFDFSIRSSAYDVGFLIDRIKSANGTAHIYAWSYGTLWTNQYLQLFPNQVESVVLDGIICPSGPKGIRTALTTWDTDLNRVGYFFMDECKNDDFCNKKLGIAYDDTRAFVKGTFTNLGNKCSVLGWDIRQHCAVCWEI